MSISVLNPQGQLSDVSGIRVGHWTDRESLTGCSVILCEQPFVCSVDVRGGAPGTRETDLLVPGRLVEQVDAIVLAGGSAFGLAAADGVMRWLHERGRGYPTGVVPVPIVPAAIIFDLGLGRPAWPDAAAGYAAAAAAAREFETGCVGAGTGASVGKFLDPLQATKSGLGTASLRGPGGLIVAALAVVNALGNVVRSPDSKVIAGARLPTGGFADFMSQHIQPAPPFGNTVIGVVATNATLSRPGAQRVAQVAHDGIARAIRPAHTLHDGDTIFVLATGEVGADLSLVGEFGAEAFALAIVNAVLTATACGGLPAARDVAGVGSL